MKNFRTWCLVLVSVTVGWRAGKYCNRPEITVEVYGGAPVLWAGYNGAANPIKISIGHDGNYGTNKWTWTIK